MTTSKKKSRIHDPTFQWIIGSALIIISILVAIFMPEGWKGNLNPKALSNSPDTIVLPESEQTKDSNEIESTSKKTDIEIKK